MKTLSKTFLTGLVTVLPLFLTAYLLYWFATSAERLLGAALQTVLPAGAYWPGMGLLAAVVLIFAVGVMMHAWVVRALVGLGEKLLYRIPLIKSVYGALRDFFGLFSRSEQDGARQPVMVQVGELDILGFVMREDFSGLPPGIGGEDRVAVYLPMSYQVGGYTAMVPRARIRPLDMTMEQAMRFALTAGLSTTSAAPSGAARRRRT